MVQHEATWDNMRQHETAIEQDFFYN